MFNADLFIFLFIGFLFCSLILVVLSRGLGSGVNRAFLIFSSLVFFWMVSNYTETAVKDLYLASIFLRLDFCLAAVAIFGLLYFCYRLTDAKSSLEKLWPYLIWPLVVALLSFSNLIIDNANFGRQGQLTFDQGSLFWLYASCLFVYLSLGIYRLLRGVIKLKGEDRAKIVIVILGVGLSTLSILIITLFFQNVFSLQIFHIGAYGTLLMFISFMAYAIIRHHFMDIRLILRSSFVYVTSLITIILPAIIIRVILGERLTVAGWIDLAVVVFAIAVFPKVKTYYYKIANKYFFSSLYDSSELIADLSEKMRETLEIQKIYSSISEILTQSFHCKGIGILRYTPKSGNYREIFNAGLGAGKGSGSGSSEIGSPGVPRDTISHSGVPHSKDALIKLIADERLHKKFILKNESIIIPELKRERYKKYKRTIDAAEHFGIAVLVPLNVKNKTIGLIAIGKKESGDAYNQEDLKVLSIVSAQSAIAIENALLYDQTKEFTRTLQGKVDAATKELRKKNVELQKLDKMKSEFVSVASHQLRTPLTAIKWGLEIMQEDKKVKFNKKQRDYLGDIADSNDRLIKLVNELLNISRIDDGRLKIDPVPTDICALTRSVLKEYEPIIRHKNLRLIEKCDVIPKIRLDQNIITKAISNFISNAIKYNRDGKRLHVLIKKYDKENILITIRDEGIGIPEAEQKNIFKKFYRASNAATSNTEGTGLGLYIAKSAIEQSGGKVWFESVAGQGTTFYVTLPMKGSRVVKGERTLS